MTHDLTLPADDTLEAKRDTIRRSVNEIAADLNSALVAAGLACPIYLCVPASGDAIVTFACPLDPDDNECDRITEIVREIVGKKIGAARLTTRELACAIGGGATIGGAEVTIG
jgi:hypothetical protein